MASISELLEELSRGSGHRWAQTQEMCLQGCLDWLLRDDPEVVEMLRNERDMYRHHHKRELWDTRMSLANQAAGQDLGCTCWPLLAWGQATIGWLLPHAKGRVLLSPRFSSTIQRATCA